MLNNLSFKFPACLEGFYGPACSISCGNCASGDACNHIDGTCPSGCEPGWVVGTCSEGKVYMRRDM